MITVSANAALRDFLGQVTEAAEIRDPAGNLLGYFKPRAEVDAELYEHAQGLFDVAETERIATTQHGQGRPFDEVLRGLESGETGLEVRRIAL